MSKLGLRLAIVSAVVLVTFYYLLRSAPVEVEVKEVLHGSLTVSVLEDGKTRVKDRYIVSAPVAGSLRRINLNVGERVVSGETVLATIKPGAPVLLDNRSRREAEARFKAAEAEHKRAEALIKKASEAKELAQHNFEKRDKLIKAKAISQEEFDEAEHQFRVANEEYRASEFLLQIARFEMQQTKAALDLVSEELSESENSLVIRSPISGVILRLFQESAVDINTGTALMEIGDVSQLEVVIDVLSKDAQEVRPGMRVFFEESDRGMEGRVRIVEPSGFTKVSALGIEEQRVNVIVDFVSAASTWMHLGDSYRVDGRIVLSQNDNVTLVPMSALFRRNNQWIAFVFENGRAFERIIQIGKDNGYEAEVIDGLREGEMVIVHPSDRIESGMLVKH